MKKIYKANCPICGRLLEVEICEQYNEDDGRNDVVVNTQCRFCNIGWLYGEENKGQSYEEVFSKAKEHWKAW